MKSVPVLRMLICMCLSVLCAATVISALPTEGEEQLYDRVIRLHVLAHSDSIRDQTLKLRVRDAVLQYLNTAVQPKNAAEADAVCRSHMPALEHIAEQTLAEAGYPYPCRVTLTNEQYPQRTYQNGSNVYTLPAGTYRSLRILIGEGAGQNWWCVLFPPLCLSLAVSGSAEADAVPAAVYETEVTTADGALAAVGFTPYEISLISGKGSPKTVVKFRLVEWIRRMLSK